MTNSASVSPFINGQEADDVYDFNQIPPTTDPLYVRSGGPLKLAQVLNGAVSEPASLELTGDTTLIFDIFRPWPRNEVNQNLEYPIFATVLLSQDSGGIYRRLNKVTGADIGWSQPTYSFNIRQTTEDLAFFRETINPDGDDAPVAYTSYFERAQLALIPEFDTEQLTALAIWADGSTPPFLRGDPIRNLLDVRVMTTNNPGETVDLSATSSAQTFNSNMFSIAADYKVDMRLHGRFINYRITDAEDPAMTNDRHQSQWNVSGLQADIMKGGTR